MKLSRIAFFFIFCASLLVGCAKPPPHPPGRGWDVAEQLTEQFRRQHDAKPQSLPARKLKAVQVTGFSYPAGNVHPYLGIGVEWEGTGNVNYTGVPMVQLGDGLFGVTYQDSTTKEEFWAVISFR